MQKVNASARLGLIMTLVLLLGASSLGAPGALGNPADTGGPGQPASENPVEPQEMPPIERASRAIPSPDVEVYIDGSRLYLPDPPAIHDGRTLVPMRHFFEALDADVSWDAANRIARGYRDGIKVLIPIWSNQPTVNGKIVTIDVAAQIWNDRTYIPLRFVGESLGDDVSWDGVRRRIDITRGESPGPSPGDDPQPLGSETVSPSDDDQTVTLGDVKVTIPGGVLDQAQEVSVSYLGSGREPPDADVEELMLWQVKVGNMREFRHPIAIEFPYDPAAVPAGEDPEGLFIGLRWDRNQNDWVELPAGVNTQSQTVTVTTTSLSEVGWARLRRAHYVEDDRFIVYFRDNHQPTVYDEQGQLMTPEEYARLVLRYLNEAHDKLVGAPPGGLGFRDPRQALWTNRKIRVWTGAFDVSQYNDRTGTISITAYQDAMLENRLPVPGSGMEGARHDVAHEYFHAIQNSYMTWVSMRARYWWMEATADYAAGGVLGTGLLRDLDQEYFQNPIYYRGGDECLHMYETANFVKFLVEEKGMDFQEMWVASVEWPFDFFFQHFTDYIFDRTDSYWCEVYREFALWTFFSQGGPAGEPLNDMGQESVMALTEHEVKHNFALDELGTAALWVVRPEIDQTEKERTLQVSITDVKRDALESSVDVLVLPDNQRVAGTPRPQAELQQQADSVHTFPETVTVKQGETLYLLANNPHPGRQDIEVSVQGAEAQVAIVEEEFTGGRPGPDDKRYYAHRFVAEAEPAPDDRYIFEWDFGDGTELTDRPERHIFRSIVNHEYLLSPMIWTADFDVTVRLYDLDGNLLAEDSKPIASGALIEYEP